MAGVDADALEEAWQQVEAHWDDESAHRRFLELSRLAGDLQGAGQRYRRARETDPGRAQMASRQIDRLLGLAMQEMQTLRTPPRPRRRLWVWLATALASALLVVLLGTLLRMH